MSTEKTSVPPPVAPWWLRAALVVVGLGLWFLTQAMIGNRKPPNGIGDLLLDATAPVNAWLVSHHAAADLLLIVSSLVIDLLGVFLLAWSIVGRSVRPFLGLLMLFALRQICQGLCALPIPPDMIWRQPMLFGVNISSLLVTYPVGNDLFFSGHTALAVYGAVELARLGGRWLPAVAVVIALFEMAAVIVLRAHWTMDVYTGAVTAVMAALISVKVAPCVDQFLASLAGRK